MQNQKDELRAVRAVRVIPRCCRYCPDHLLQLKIAPEHNTKGL